MSDRDEWPPRFTLDSERILSLLTGDRFYSDSSAALREAVLNAIDAVRRRRGAVEDLETQIRVVFYPDELIIDIHDNGDGMSREAVSDLFTRVGRSAADLAVDDVRPVGEFGIGVVSYFMAADVFEIQTYDGRTEPVGLQFSKRMFTGSSADELVPTRDERGTSLRLKIRDRDTFEVLRENYPHWCRRVKGLRATAEPGGELIEQGEAGIQSSPSIEVEVPDGVEEAYIRPVTSLSSWSPRQSSSAVSILYRGVFVQMYESGGLWGMEGSILVDPKHFKPRLNREGFVGDDFRQEIDSFLRTCHPVVLSALAERLYGALRDGDLNEWSARHWATLWLSVPRTDTYEAAAGRWDDIFRDIPAFEVFHNGKWEGTSVNRLTNIAGPIYVAPRKEDQQNDLVKSATRLLRETGQPVLRGLSPDRSLLRDAPRTYATTADLIASVFAGDLPELRAIDKYANDILGSLDTIHVLYGGEHPIHLVNLGDEGPPALKVQRQLLLNIDVAEGRDLVLAALDANRGRRGLIEAAAMRTPKYLGQVASIASEAVPEEDEILGLVRRAYLRGLLS